jgi:hypothetical protein
MFDVLCLSATQRSKSLQTPSALTVLTRGTLFSAKNAASALTMTTTTLRLTGNHPARRATFIDDWPVLPLVARLNIGCPGLNRRTNSYYKGCHKCNTPLHTHCHNKLHFRRNGALPQRGAAKEKLCHARR